jgi:glycine dehydrogenase subunit 2
MLIEPTETESKAELDRFIEVMRALAAKATGPQGGELKASPHYAPVRRLDETKAARRPVLRWTPPGPIRAAAE